VNAKQITDRLEANASVFAALLREPDSDVYRWKPAAEKWCLLEIVCHLHDEEREDFRARTKHVLETPDKELPSIDPTGWVTSRGYMAKDYEQTLKAFLQQRSESVKWLRSLVNPSWQNAYLHPKFGAMSADMFMSNWLAHDYLHFRQITTVRYRYHEQRSKEPLTYAGNW
jgi:hypothetical protein